MELRKSMSYTLGGIEDSFQTGRSQGASRGNKGATGAGVDSRGTEAEGMQRSRAEAEATVDMTDRQPGRMISTWLRRAGVGGRRSVHLSVPAACVGQGRCGRDMPR